MSDSHPTTTSRSLKSVEVTLWLVAGSASVFACWFYYPSVPAGEGRFESNWFLNSGLWYLAILFPAVAVGAAIGAVRGHRLNDAVSAFIVWIAVLFLWLLVGAQLLST